MGRWVGISMALLNPREAPAFWQAGFGYSTGLPPVGSIRFLAPEGPWKSAGGPSHRAGAKENPALKGRRKGANARGTLASSKTPRSRASSGGPPGRNSPSTGSGGSRHRLISVAPPGRSRLPFQSELALGFSTSRRVRLPALPGRTDPPALGHRLHFRARQPGQSWTKWPLPCSASSGWRSVRHSSARPIVLRGWNAQPAGGWDKSGGKPGMV
jgi:hypothetical protein